MNEKIRLATEKTLDSIIGRIPAVVAAVIVLFITWAVAKALRRVIRATTARLGSDPHASAVAGRLASVGVWVIGTLIAASLAIPNFNFATMVTTLGIGSIAIGFAFKEIFENFFSGMYLMLTRPFKVGDVIEADGVRGTVEEIGMRATKVRLFDKEMMVIPSSKLFRESVRVVTNASIRRFSVRILVAFESNLEEAERLSLEAATSLEGVLDDPKPFVVYDKITPDAVEFMLYWWVDTANADVMAVNSSVVKAVLPQLVAAEDIQTPMPRLRG